MKTFALLAALLLTLSASALGEIAVDAQSAAALELPQAATTPAPGLDFTDPAALCPDCI